MHFPHLNCQPFGKKKEMGETQKAMVQKEFLPLLKDEYFTHHCFTPCMVFRSFFGGWAASQKKRRPKAGDKRGKDIFFLTSTDL